MLPKVTEFSSGYYLVEDMYVEPDDTVQFASIEPGFYRYIRDSVYDGSRVPVTMKYSNTHFSVNPSPGVPIDTMSVPPGTLDDMNESAPGDGPILLANPKSSYRVSQIRANEGYNV